MKQSVVIYIGLPGSGKSTAASAFLKEQAEKDPGHRWVRINRDDLRAMAAGSAKNPHKLGPQTEALLRTVKTQMLRAALESGASVILDDTHLNPKVINHMTKEITDYVEASLNPVVVHTVRMGAGIKTCLERNSHRSDFTRVPDDVIEGMAKVGKVNDTDRPDQKDAKAIYPGIYGVPVHNNPNLPSAVLCDLDGTLAHIGDRSPYDASLCDVVDTPNVAVVDAVRSAVLAGHEIVFMSGRDAKYRDATERFIRAHCSFLPETFRLYMRAAGDQARDSIVKENLFYEHILDRNHVVYVLDDRDQVVRMWRMLGLTVFQVGYGNF